MKTVLLGATDLDAQRALKGVVLAIVIALILHGCGRDADPAHSLRPAHSEDTDVNLSVQTLTQAGVDREYLLYIPASYDGTQNVYSN